MRTIAISMIWTAACWAAARVSIIQLHTSVRRRHPRHQLHFGGKEHIKWYARLQVGSRSPRRSQPSMAETAISALIWSMRGTSEDHPKGEAWSTGSWSIPKYDESINFVACVCADIWRRLGWDGRSAVFGGTSLALGLQGRRKADRRPDWHTDRTRTGSVDRIRKNHV